MIVKELIQELQKYDQEKNVYTESTDDLGILQFVGNVSIKETKNGIYIY